MPENNLAGSLPSLSGLAALQEFGANYNKLTGTIPSLNGMAALRRFYVIGNQFTGAIPQLSGMTALEDFWVMENQLTGTLPSLSGLSALKTFAVTYNQLTGTIAELSAVTTLQVIGVGHNQFTGSIPPLNGLTALRIFHAPDNQFTGSIPPLSGLTALQDFRVHKNQLTGSIPSLSGLTALQDFEVDNNQLSGSIPAPPASLPPYSESESTRVGASLCNNNLTSSGVPSIDAAWVTAQSTNVPKGGVAAGNWLACQTVTTYTINNAASPSPITGLWWNQNESGWGVTLTQQYDVIFVTMFAYDGAGNPTWYVVSNCAVSGGGCQGELSKVTGGSIPTATWNGANIAETPVGTLNLSFTDDNTGAMNYTINGVPGSKAITRQVWRTAPVSPVVLSAGYTINNAASPSPITGLWWNQNESGWGATLTQQYDVIFVTMFAYDGAGNPTWYVVSNCAVSGGGCQGDLSKVTGGSIPTATWNGANIAETSVGTLSLSFTDDNTGAMNYTINGVPGSKAITRQVWRTAPAAPSQSIPGTVAR